MCTLEVKALQPFHMASLVLSRPWGVSVFRTRTSHKNPAVGVVQCWSRSFTWARRPFHRAPRRAAWRAFSQFVRRLMISPVAAYCSTAVRRRAALLHGFRLPDEPQFRFVIWRSILPPLDKTLFVVAIFRSVCLGGRRGRTFASGGKTDLHGFRGLASARGKQVSVERVAIDTVYARATGASDDRSRSGADPLPYDRQWTLGSPIVLRFSAGSPLIRAMSSRTSSTPAARTSSSTVSTLG